jgi:hypothetical protein
MERLPAGRQGIKLIRSNQLSPFVLCAIVFVFSITFNKKDG